jgi:hypothetical protein
MVDVYFIPAMVTLTLQASGDGGDANMTANEAQGGGLEPIGPVYCGYTYPANPLPCKVMVRVEKLAQVEANTAGDPNIVLAGFSSNCTLATAHVRAIVLQTTAARRGSASARRRELPGRCARGPAGQPTGSSSRAATASMAASSRAGASPEHPRAMTSNSRSWTAPTAAA